MLKKLIILTAVLIVSFITFHYLVNIRLSPPSEQYRNDDDDDLVTILKEKEQQLYETPIIHNRIINALEDDILELKNELGKDVRFEYSLVEYDPIDIIDPTEYQQQ